MTATNENANDKKGFTPYSPNPESYTKFVTALASQYTMESFLTKLGTVGLGLAGESAEVGNILNLKQHSQDWTENDGDRLIDELGDICWYVAFAAGNVVEVRFEELYLSFHCGEVSDSPIESFKASYIHLSRHCGGFADIVKKLLYHGKPYSDQIRHDLIDRLKNIMCSVGFIARGVCGASIEDLMQYNITKLSERYKGLKFNTQEFLAKEEAK